MPFAYWCVLIAAILPLVWAGYSKSGGEGDNRYPREEYENLTPPKRRAYAAHQNAYENFPFFAAAAIVAVTQGAPATIVNVLSGIYVVLRVGHGLLYVSNQPSLRSLTYAVALLVNIALFVSPLFK